MKTPEIPKLSNRTLARVEISVGAFILGINAQVEFHSLSSGINLRQSMVEANKGWTGSVFPFPGYPMEKGLALGYSPIQILTLYMAVGGVLLIDGLKDRRSGFGKKHRAR